MNKIILTLAILFIASVSYAQTSCDKIANATEAQIDALLIGLSVNAGTICGVTTDENGNTTPNTCTLNQKKLYINQLIWKWANDNYRRGKQIQNDIIFNSQFAPLP
jgi:hypothetical protein